jgi:multidrug efflux pump subunit AcrB
MVGDQSPFIKAAVSGVVREGVIAAALTALTRRFPATTPNSAA